MTCACNNRGLGEPYAISDYVVAGSVIEWGGYLRASQQGASYPLSSDLKDAVEGCLYNTGGFSDVTATEQSGAVNIYIGIRVICANDFQHLQDVWSLIVGQIQNCVGLVADTQAFWLLSVPPTVQGSPTVAQPGAGGSSNPGPLTTTSNWHWPSFSLPSFPGSDGQKNFLDTWATWLGVGQTEAALIGAALALAGLFALNKLAK